jgi:GTPase SAR1 family protein
MVTHENTTFMLFNVFTERPLFHFQHTTYGNSGSSSSSLKGDSERDFFVELWDVSGHERYKDCRSLFYSQINGE